MGNDGALRNLSGDNTVATQVWLGTATRINSDSGTLTLNSPTPLMGYGNSLAIGGAGNVAIESPITNISAFVKDGTGALILSGSDSYTCGTLVSSGTLELTDAAALPSKGVLTVGSPSTVVLAGAAGSLFESATGSTTAMGAVGVPGPDEVANGALAEPVAPPAMATGVDVVALGSGTAAVPEPSTLALLCAGAGSARHCQATFASRLNIMPRSFARCSSAHLHPRRQQRHHAFSFPAAAAEGQPARQSTLSLLSGG